MFNPMNKTTLTYFTNSMLLTFDRSGITLGVLPSSLVIFSCLFAILLTNSGCKFD